MPEPALAQGPQTGLHHPGTSQDLHPLPPQGPQLGRAPHKVLASADQVGPRHPRQPWMPWEQSPKEPASGWVPVGPRLHPRALVLWHRLCWGNGRAGVHRGRDPRSSRTVSCQGCSENAAPRIVVLKLPGAYIRANGPGDPREPCRLAHLREVLPPWSS